jgi:hypothetical protein
MPRTRAQKERDPPDIAGEQTGRGSAQNPAVPLPLGEGVAAEVGHDRDAPLPGAPRQRKSSKSKSRGGRNLRRSISTPNLDGCTFFLSNIKCAHNINIR